MAKSNRLQNRNNPLRNAGARRAAEQPAVGDDGARRVERRNNQALPAVAAQESPRPLAAAGNNQALPAVAGTPPRGQQPHSPPVSPPPPPRGQQADSPPVPPPPQGTPPVQRRSDRVLSSVAASLAASEADDAQRGLEAYPRIVERPTGREVSTNGCSKYFWFEIDGIDEAQIPEISNRIDSRINQLPRRGRISDVRVTIGDDDEEVNLPTHQGGSACFKHALFIYLRNHRSIRGYICCYNLPHPDSNNCPPRDHHSPKTKLGRKIYTGFGAPGNKSATQTLSSEVKMELLHCLGGVVTSNDDITVVALSDSNPIVKGLMVDRDQLMSGNSPIKVFENNGSIHCLRQKLIHAVGGDSSKFYECVNGGGVAGLTPRDIVVQNDSEYDYGRLCEELQQSIDPSRRNVLFRANENAEEYFQTKASAEENRVIWLRNANSKIATSNFSLNGAVDKHAFAADMAAQIMADAGGSGRPGAKPGFYTCTITVRTDEVQPERWTNVDLPQTARDLIDPENQGNPPPLNNSIERWNRLRGLDIGLFGDRDRDFEEGDYSDLVYGCYCSVVYIAQQMNLLFADNGACLFASNEPNDDGKNCHIQFLCTVQLDHNGNLPHNFLSTLRNLIWSVGVQLKSGEGAQRMSLLDYEGAAIDWHLMSFNELVQALLYMMKEQLSHSRCLLQGKQRAHHSDTKSGVQSGGLMIHWLPHAKPEYLQYFSRVRYLVKAIPYNSSTPQHHYPPNFPQGNFLEPPSPIIQLHNDFVNVDNEEVFRRHFPYGAGQLRFIRGTIGFTI